MHPPSPSPAPDAVGVQVKHIDGPWLAVREDDPDDPGWRIYGTMPSGMEGCYLVAEVLDGNGSPRNAASKNLIIAAPELLQALQWLMEVERRGRLMPIGREWDAARAAIAKATGGAA